MKKIEGFLLITITLGIIVATGIVLSKNEGFGILSGNEKFFDYPKRLIYKIENITKGSNFVSNFYLDRISSIQKKLLEEEFEFLEVNLEKKTITRYSGGRELKIPILALGNVQGWGGTPAGLYKVNNKNKAAFSNAYGVYMPYAINFYGPYFIHGEPYFPSGQKSNSSLSSGCIRVRDDDIVKLFDTINEGAKVLVIDKENDYYSYEKLLDVEKPKLTAPSYLIADLDSGFVLAEENYNKDYSIASLTKLMTAVIVTENSNLRRKITATASMLEAFGSTNGIYGGGRYGIVELLYPLLIHSSNDAAEILAGFQGRDKTIKLMNEKTSAIFMENTSFVDPSGLDPKNRSSAADLFYLARYIYNNQPPIFNVTKSREVRTFTPVKFFIGSIRNRNIFHEYDSFIGGKTGYLPESNHNGLFIFNSKTSDEAERKIAFIVLGSEELEEDTKSLIEWAQINYDLEIVNF